jgi:hypothetical protein
MGSCIFTEKAKFCAASTESGLAFCAKQRYKVGNYHTHELASKL